MFLGDSTSEDFFNDCHMDKDKLKSLIHMIECKYGAEYASVMCRGKAKILQNAADKCEALRILMRVQTGEEHEINEKMVNAVCVIEINVDSYTAKACLRQLTTLEIKGENKSCCEK